MRSLKPRTLLLLMVAALALLATPSFAVDLVIDEVSFIEGPEAGECNTVRFKVRNASDELANQITAVLVKVFPSNNAFQVAFQKKVFLSSFLAGATQQRDVSNVSLPSQGTQYTLQVLADADQQLAETNENNNLETQFVTPSSTCGGGECDLTAVFTSPRSSNIPATYDARFAVRFRNQGGAACPAKQVQLTRGSATVDTKSLQALNPGQSRSLGLREAAASHPSSGSHTYGISYQGGHSDADNGNHTPNKTVTFTSRGGGNDPNPAGCDLQVTFNSPSGTEQGGRTVPFVLRIRNVGSAGCNAFKLKLMRYSGKTCSGYGTQVGGSGNWQSVLALNAGGSATARFQEAPAPRRGTFCYQLGYSPGNYSDANNANHRPRQTVSYQ